MSLLTLAADLGSCGSAKLVMRSPLDLVQFTLCGAMVVGLAWACRTPRTPC